MRIPRAAGSPAAPSSCTLVLAAALTGLVAGGIAGTLIERRTAERRDAVRRDTTRVAVVDPDTARVLRVYQPALLGLIDGALASIGYVLSIAVLVGPRAALIVGLIGAVGHGIDMGVAEGLSDTGEKTGRGRPLLRATVTGFGAFAGGSIAPVLLALIPSLEVALPVTAAVLLVQLGWIGYLRARWLSVPIVRSVFHLVVTTIAVMAVTSAANVVGSWFH